MDINIRSVIYINGIIVCCLSAIMLIPIFFDLIFAMGNCVKIFLPSILVGIFLGGLMIFSCRTKRPPPFSGKDIFLLVVSMWLITSIVCAFPFYVYSGINLDFVSALFESVSGITTTGATIYQDVEILPKALNLWRFILHFIGGVGIVAIGVIILPIMKIGGMQLFTTENSDKSQKFLPRASQMIGFFVGVYIILITIFMVLLKICGMNLFDSVCHSISAISTGGFSTKNIGIDWFKSSRIQFVMSIGMFVGGITFLEIVKLFKNGLKAFMQNEQIRGYFILVASAIFFPIILQAVVAKSGISLGGVSSHVFVVISAITTTGLEFSNNYMPSELILILLAIIGGCSGSTSGGIKIFRIQILYSILKNHIKKIIKPFDVTMPKYQNKKIDNSLVISIASFIMTLFTVFCLSEIVIEVFSNNPIHDCSYSTLSCLFNLGCGSNFSGYQSLSKVVLIIDMIIGRLEFIPFIIVISRGFWKNL